MADVYNPGEGMRRIVKNIRKQFRIPENLNHYTEADFQEAEKKYLKFCLQEGCGVSLRE
jgi:hypothetical protein